MTFRAIIITLFPEIFPGPLGLSLAGQALLENRWKCEVINIRDFAAKHGRVDDYIYGGDGGMVIMPQVAADAIDYALSLAPNAMLYYTTPSGALFNQTCAYNMSMQSDIIILCGRYEGVDSRVIASYQMREVSIGDYVMSGGELAALVMLDSVIRLLPGVVANQQNIESESFQVNSSFAGLLESCVYTKPLEWRGMAVPEILTSGHHMQIADYKIKESARKTLKNRPELLR
ncbi:tRNA (guanine-N(1)-)-methyltransferase [Rickettsiales endosymbiont of Paramecium tredecaurelia]|uniref:tRNA (guanosine(37)-N1)-methyltransferase TrmD n=1 Tax=Candidatus Sarmatiella mevalonica TaxID=2770581 RepID=UPI001923F142|nr:tRNA (guanosine(37)-N1)-methyltransferase TrmD [Candidatus Sarmatiella mevalonica]MBL3285152.1 tRNA (guanine-N(1)-)-methyltransferase [Candidatus Sarmatiella mevalonica]